MFASRWQASSCEYLRSQLQRVLTAQQMAEISPALEVTQSLFEGVRTQKQEEAVTRARMLPLAPRPRVFGNGPAPDVVDVPVPATLERLLQHDPYARDLILRASEQYKQGDMHCVESEWLNDITDGSIARNHPHLLRAASPDEVDDVRIGLIVYYDDVEVCNPLGVAKGKHSIGCFYYAIINLPPRLRMSKNCVQLFSLASSKALKQYGAARSSAVWTRQTRYAKRDRARRSNTAKTKSAKIKVACTHKAAA